MTASALVLVGTAYLIGSIPTGYWLGKLWRGVDVRQEGSGNLGATNVFRVLGKGPGVVTLLIDILKGFLPVFWCQRRFPEASALAISAGLAAILGHTASIFVRFRGGKGVATSAGVFAALLPGPLLASVGVFVLSLLLTRFVSLSSTLAALTLAVVSFFGATPTRLHTGLAVFVAIAVIWKHRGNIRRLWQGSEPRLWSKKSA